MKENGHVLASAGGGRAARGELLESLGGGSVVQVETSAVKCEIMG